MTENELYHHGIKGQSWGVRRYQNEDGSLTSAGKERYSQKFINGVRTTVTNMRNKRLSNTVSVTPSKNASSGMVEYSKGDRDFDDSNYKEENRVSTKNNGETDFFLVTRPDGTRVLLEEDMKWEIAPGENVEEKVDAIIGELHKQREDRWNNKALDDAEIDSYANAVIRGDFGNGAERKEKLGAHYDEVQRRVNEKLRHYDYNPNELYHHGILGMKWGVRRYQNEDGSYTSAGKIRRRNGTISAKKAYKNVGNMSDDELRKINNRIQQEKQLKRYAEEESAYYKGKQAAKEILYVAGTAAALYGLSQNKALMSAGKAFTETALGVALNVLVAVHPDKNK